MNRYSASILLIMINSLGVTLVAEDHRLGANGPSKEVAELVPLNHWVGSFESRTESPVRTKAASKGEWILGGRFLKYTFIEEATDSTPAISGSLIMTYDVAQENYRYWSFLSDGSSLECVGDWDAPSRTMTWTGSRQAGFVQTYEVRFDENGGSTWSIVIRAKNGDTVYESQGRNVPVSADGVASFDDGQRVDPAPTTSSLLRRKKGESSDDWMARMNSLEEAWSANWNRIAADINDKPPPQELNKYVGEHVTLVGKVVELNPGKSWRLSTESGVTALLLVRRADEPDPPVSLKDVTGAKVFGTVKSVDIAKKEVVIQDIDLMVSQGGAVFDP